MENHEATFIKGSFVHNARAAYSLPGSGLEISVFVNNISDERRQNFVFDLTTSNGNLIQSYAKPRWWGVSIRKDF